MTHHDEHPAQMDALIARADRIIAEARVTIVENHRLSLQGHALRHELRRWLPGATSDPVPE